MSIRYQEVEAHTAYDDLVRTDRICLFWEMFEKLGADCQKVMRMGFDERTTEEVQAELGFADPGSVKVKKFKCKQQLEKLIKADKRFDELKV